MESKRILIVEDEDFLRDIYADTLKDSGYTVESVADGNSALEKMKAGGYDLVLLDIMLPNKDGQQIMQEHQKNPPHKANKKVVYMTNLAQDSILVNCEELGVSSYLIKSDLNPEEFLNRVKGYLK